MEQQTQPQPQQQPPAGQTPPSAPAKKSTVWIWILGGCLAVILIGGIVMAGLAWWGAKKVKNVIKENQPKLEEMQKGAADWQKQAEQMQKQAQDMQKNLPQPPDSFNAQDNLDGEPSPY